MKLRGKGWLLGILLLFVATVALGQRKIYPQDVDSLLALAKKSPDMQEDLLLTAVNSAEEIEYDAGVVNGYKGLIDLYHSNDEVVSELRMYLYQNRYFKRASLFPEQIASYTGMGDLYFTNHLYDKARESYLSALVLAKNSDPDAYYYASKRYGASLHKEGELARADSAYSESIKRARVVKNGKEILWLLQQKGDIAHQSKEYEKEIRLGGMMLRVADSLDLATERLIALNNLGYAYKYREDPKKAESYFDTVLVILDQKPSGRVEAEVLKNLGILYQNEERYVSADSALANAAQSYRKLKNTEAEAAVYDFRALVYFQKGDLYNAKVYNKKAIELSDKKSHYRVLERSYLTEHFIYDELHNYEEALRSYKDHLNTKDLADSIENARSAELNAQQAVMIKLEKQLNGIWVKEEMQKLELDASLAREAAKEDRIKALKADSITQDTKLRNEQLRAKEALQQLILAEEQRKVERQQAELRALEQEKAIAAAELLLEQQRAEAEQKKAEEERRKAQLAKQESRIKDLELAAQGSFIRNLTYVLIGLLVLVALILLAYRQLRSKNKKIAAQQVVIAAEKEKSDALLLNILPATVAAELKEHGASKPRQFNEITVIFTDFVGFTMISEQLSPAELVEALDKIFLEFDLIIEKHGMQRIKTIGDAYMCACGLPEPMDDHAKRAVTAAIEMRDFMQKFNAEVAASAPKWNIRIGVNSGPVVAGVVGIKKFAYDIWGDAVNVASRMESSGESGKVNMSQSTYDLVQGSFATTHRGKVKAKNKGDIDMYFVEMLD